MVNEIRKILNDTMSDDIVNIFYKFMSNEDNIVYFLENINNMSSDCELLSNSKSAINQIKEVYTIVPLRKELLELIDYNCNKFNSIIDDNLCWIYTKDDLNYLDMSIVDILENIDINNFDIYDDCFTFDSKYGLLISMKYNDYVEYIDSYVETMNYEQLQTAIKKLKHTTTI